MTLNQTDIPSHDLLALKPTLFFPRSLTFTHSFASTNPIRPSIDHKMATAMPVFNYDGQHFTPAFVLGVDQNYYVLNEEFELQKHMEKIRQANIEISNSDLHQVSPSSNFCQVCRTSYEDYYIHISETVHKKNLKKPTAHRYIEQLCAQYPKTSSKSVKVKTKNTQKKTRRQRKIKQREVQFKTLASYPTNSVSLTCPLQ